MATGGPAVDEWYGTAGEVGRRRGLLFQAACLGATALALVLMLVFLLYVFNDAVQPATADTGWLATVAVTVVLPALGLAAYYYLNDRTAGRIAYTALGVPFMSAMVAGAVWIGFAHLIEPHAWFALVLSATVAAGVVRAYGRLDRDAPLERLAVLTLVPWFALVGVPAVSVDYTVRTPFLGQELFPISVAIPTLVPSLRAVILSLPVLPTEPLALLASFAVPVALAAGWHLRRVRESDRDAAVAAGAVTVAAAVGLAVAPAIGWGPTSWIVLVTVVGTGTGLYVEHVLRRGEGVSGLALPVLVAVGALVGWGIVRLADFAGPDTWLDAGFLTSAHSTTPTNAGIYPALIGSVFLLVVIVVFAFPVGVGAAIYLEEYAPSKGRMGRVVELIEINIANLAGVPSVVYGVLGLTVFIRTVGMGNGTPIVGGLTVGLLILPIVIISAQEAIRAVPDSLRQASYGMGATRWQTTRNVVLPRALPGIFTGTILALGRAIGETAPLLMIQMPAIVRRSPESFFSTASAMPRQILQWSTLIKTDFRYGVLAAGVVTLLVVLLTMNATAIVLRNRYQRG
ncbi:phosphate ABC transporter permease PstA [Salinilacihabitans rarus]|uniref:phosphate ABC transporter permease PstA n=1 Tax=Salinilacihabitans rarus TaxID=2961596 RepID=UPI0020C8FF35|nr:phosphate ABC transporter permease PstA [Salinilacihabitans rarus]